MFPKAEENSMRIKAWKEKTAILGRIKGVNFYRRRSITGKEERCLWEVPDYSWVKNWETSLK